ncbi:MAG: hypothetical protein ACFFA7_04765 [Promethearchaeota archaeon]
MRKKYFLIMFLVFTLISTTNISLAFYTRGEIKADEPTLKELPSRSLGNLEGIDGTPCLEGLTMVGAQPDTGNPWTVPVSDDYYGGFYYQDFECVLQGVHCNVWIGLNPDIWDGGFQDYYDPGGSGFEDDTWYFVYPWSSIGLPGPPDPDEDGYYLPPGYCDWITGADLLHVVDEFDNNIHDTVVSHFGEYADRPGPLNDYKIQILIFNIRDGLFYDPINAPWFTIGYFWSFASNLNDANIFHMDTYQWWRRLDYPTPPLPYGLNPLPLQYEGTFAHEFQHLVHYDVDSDELSWVNEGCSTLAEWICGYGFSPGHISEYLIYWWDVSLVIWQGTLADYGAVFLWTFYMYEHYGGAPLIWDLTHEQTNGIEGWNNVLAKHHIKKSFDEIFEDWCIANYLDDTSFKRGIYGYYALDIPSADTEWYDIPYTLWMWEYLYPNYFDTQVDTYPNYGYNYPFGTSLPYQANYVEFYPGGKKYVEMNFYGDAYSGVVAHSGTYEWYSGGDAWAWFTMSHTFDIPTSGATLNFWTYFEIEEDWDFGYVEVHDLDTDEWYTLPGLATVGDVGYNLGTDNPNCPDYREPTTYYYSGRWNGFTGLSPGWYEESMDLSIFAGHEIELFFTYWTDPYTLELGWYIDDIEIPEIGFYDDVESGEDDWTVNTGWYITDGAIPNDFEVNFIETISIFRRGTLVRTKINIASMNVDDVTEDGRELLTLLDTKTVQTYNVMVVANQPGYEHTFGSFYSFIAS